MYELPTQLIIDGNPFKIRNNGDYRLILNVIDDLSNCIEINEFKDEKKINLEYLYSAIIGFFEDINTIDDIYANFNDFNAVLEQMYIFINCGQKLENSRNNNLKLIDWERDEQLIVSAINNVAKTEIRALPYLHWWTFISYYMGIGECSLAHIVAIRKKLATGKKLEKHEKEFKQENPEYFVSKQDELKQIQMQEYIDDIWVD